MGVVVAHAAESGPQGTFCQIIFTSSNYFNSNIFLFRPVGVPMVPVSWTEMQCPETLAKEPRKVAKIVPESAVQEAANNKTIDD